MSLSVGIVGLPNVGKSTLFNALVEKGKALTGKFPFTTIEKNVGVVPVPDPILPELAKRVGAEKITPTTISFVDIAGLVKGAHQGEGLGNQFLGHIREVDLILHVVRFFTEETVPHLHPNIDPENDAEVVETELLLADLVSLQKQVEKLKKEKKGKEEERLILLGEKILEGLNLGKKAGEMDFSDEEKKLAKKFNLLTLKPIVYVANIDESELKSPPKKIGQNEALTLAAKFEEELVVLPWTEQRQFLKTYGLKDSAVEKVIASCYQTLEILTFYTIVGGKEVRAWTGKKGITAIEAAGKIHSDFAKHFIKAEVLPAQTFFAFGSWAKAKEAGKIAVVGRDYSLSDKEIIQIKAGV